MFKKRHDAHKPTSSTATSASTVTATPNAAPSPLVSPLGMTFDFEPPASPFRPSVDSLRRPQTSDGTTHSPVTLLPPILPPIQRVSGRPDSFAPSEVSRDSREFGSFGRERARADGDDVSAISKNPSTLRSRVSFEHPLDNISAVSRPSTAGGLSTASAPRMEASLFPKSEAPVLPSLASKPAIAPRSFVDSRDKPYHQPPPNPLVLRSNNSVPNMKQKVDSPIAVQLSPSPSLQDLPRKPPLKAKTMPSSSLAHTATQSSRSSTIGTPYGATSSDFPLPQHVGVRPKTAGASAKLAGFIVPTHHTTSVKPTQPKSESKQSGSKSNTQPTSTKLEGKKSPSKRKTRLFSPKTILQRRRTETETEPLPETRPESVAQGHVRKRSRVEPLLPEAERLPDPSIRGNVVHDFSAPRASRHAIGDTDLPPSQWNLASLTSEGPPRAGSLPTINPASDDSPRRSTRNPVFKEHLEEELRSERRGSSLQAETLENKDFIQRASKQSFATSYSQESAILPPFARRSQNLDPLQASLIQDEHYKRSSDPSSERERDSAFGSFHEVSPVTARGSHALMDHPMRSFSPVSPGSPGKQMRSSSRQSSRSRAGEARPDTVSDRPPSSSAGPPRIETIAESPVVASPATLHPLRESVPSTVQDIRNVSSHEFLSPQKPQDRSASAGSTSQGSPFRSSFDAPSLVESVHPEPLEPSEEVQRKSTRNPLRFVEKLASAVGHTRKNEKKVESPAKHRNSNASRFSFQFAAEELALEDKHRQVAENGEPAKHAAKDSDEDEDDLFDEDAIDDLDEMELAEQHLHEQHLQPKPLLQSSQNPVEHNQQPLSLDIAPTQSLLPLQLQPLSPTQNHSQAQPLLEHSRSDSSGKSQSMRYLRQARQMVLPNSDFKEEDGHGENQETTYADTDAFRMHSALANYSRRGSTQGTHSRQSSVQTQGPDGVDGYWRGGTIDEYLNGNLSSSDSVASASSRYPRKGSVGSLLQDSFTPVDGPSGNFSSSKSRSNFPLQSHGTIHEGNDDAEETERRERSASHGSSQSKSWSGKPSLSQLDTKSDAKDRTVSEMSFSTASDEAQGPKGDPRIAHGARSSVDPSQAQGRAAETPQSARSDTERSSLPHSSNASTVHNSVSSGASLASPISSPYSEGRGLAKLDERPGSAASAGLVSLKSRSKSPANRHRPSTLRQKRLSRVSSPSGLSIRSGHAGFLSVPSPSLPDRKSITHDLRPLSGPSSTLGAVHSDVSGGRTLSMVELADSSDSEDELATSDWNPNDALADAAAGDYRHLYVVAPPANGYLAPSPVRGAFGSGTSPTTTMFAKGRAHDGPAAPQGGRAVDSYNPDSTSLTATMVDGRESPEETRRSTSFRPTHKKSASHPVNAPMEWLSSNKSPVSSRAVEHHLDHHAVAPSVDTIYELSSAEETEPEVGGATTRELQGESTVPETSPSASGFSRDSDTLPRNEVWVNPQPEEVVSQPHDLPAETKIDEADKQSMSTLANMQHEHIHGPLQERDKQFLHSNFHYPQNSIDSNNDDIYFDDGNFEEDISRVAGGAIDESKFDDDSFLSRTNNHGDAATSSFAEPEPLSWSAMPNAAEFREPNPQMMLGDTILQGPIDAKLIPQRNPSEDAKRLETSKTVPPLPVAADSKEAYTQMQTNLQSYHAALADAATQAAVDGRFLRAPSVSTTRSTSTKFGPSSSVYSADNPGGEFGGSHVNGIGHEGLGVSSATNEMNGPQPASVSPMKMGFDFGFDEQHDAEDEDFERDDDLVAIANAEALASDDEGFYGQEFHFYGRPRSGSGSEIQAINGGYWGEDGDDGLTRNRSVREPNLTPITERSEFSTRNSFINPQQYGPPGSNLYGPQSPTIALSQLAVTPLMEDEVTSFEQLRKLRFRGGEGSNKSSSNRSSSQSLQGMHSPNVGVRAASHYDSIGGSPMAFGYSNESSASSNPSSAHPAPGIGSQEGPRSPGSNGVPSIPLDLDATPKRNTGFSNTVEPSTARKTNGAGFTAQPYGSPIHSRNGSGADSITYSREPDPENNGKARWYLERRRTSEQGDFEIIGRELVRGGWI